MLKSDQRASWPKRQLASLNDSDDSLSRRWCPYDATEQRDKRHMRRWNRNDRLLVMKRQKFKKCRKLCFEPNLRLLN